MSLLILDVDNFKTINDKYGHSVGDKVLKTIARALGRIANKRSICGRYGGEEFCVITKGMTLDAAVGEAEKLRKKIEKIAFRKAKSDFSVTTSIGVSSTHLKKYMSWKQLFDDADKALYAAKASGKNCVKLYLPDELATKVHSSS